MDLIWNPGGNFSYKKWSPLCLGGTQFKLLPKFCLQGGSSICSNNFKNYLLQSKINIGLLTTDPYVADRICATVGTKLCFLC